MEGRAGRCLHPLPLPVHRSVLAARNCACRLAAVEGSVLASSSQPRRRSEARLVTSHVCPPRARRVTPCDTVTSHLATRLGRRTADGGQVMSRRRMAAASGGPSAATARRRRRPRPRRPRPSPPGDGHVTGRHVPPFDGPRQTHQRELQSNRLAAFPWWR